MNAWLLACLLAAPAGAFPGVPSEYPRGLDFDLIESDVPQHERLVVLRGGARAPVLDVPLLNQYRPPSVEATPDRERIVIRYARAGSTTTVEAPVAYFESLLANAEGMKLQREKKYPAAAARFAAALALREDLPPAAVNLACARAMQGDASGAAAAARPLLSRDPVMIYRKIATDPELASLRERPEVRALRAARPGSARLDRGLGGFAGGAVAYSAKHGALAAISSTTFYSSDASPDRRAARLLFLDARSGRVLDDWKLAPSSVEAADRVLADLGFDVPRQEAPEVSGWSLELIADPRGEKRLRARRGARAVEGAPIADAYVDAVPQKLDGAVSLPELKLAVAFWTYYSGEGGGDWAYRAPALLALP